MQHINAAGQAVLLTGKAFWDDASLDSRAPTATSRVMSLCLTALQGKTPPPAEKKKEEVDKPAAQANGKVGFSTGAVGCAGVTAQELVMCMQPPCCSLGQRHSGCAAAQVEHLVSGML